MSYIPDFDSTPTSKPQEDISPEEDRIDRLKREYSKDGSFPRFTEYLMRDAAKNRAYLRGKAGYTGSDPEKLAEKEAALQAIYEMQRQGQIDRMKALNATPGKLNSCKYCLGKGYTVGLRDGFELVAHACACVQTK
jgi:hypothetical protein